MRPERRPSARALVRRAPHLVVYWLGDRLVFENYLTGARYTAEPEALGILAHFNDWRDPARIAADFPHYQPASLTRAVDKLLRATLLERTNGRRPTARAGDGWTSWHPAAGLLHFSTKDLTYDHPERVTRALRALSRRKPRPAPIKRYRRAPQVELPAPRADGEFARVLLDRRTWRRFARRPVSLAALSTLLGLSARVQHWADVADVGRLPLKTYPSGGAQHPLEVYVVARRVSGLPAGLYHYASDAHTLERLKKGATARQIARYLPTQDWYGAAAALIVITAVFPRMQWKYRFPRAYRAVLTEAGHLCQNLCLTATWLGLAPFCSLALADSAIERDLGIDGVSESVLYAAGVGARPADTDWAPWPTRQRRIRRVPNTRLS